MHPWKPILSQSLWEHSHFNTAPRLAGNTLNYLSYLLKKWASIHHQTYTAPTPAVFHLPSNHQLFLPSLTSGSLPPTPPIFIVSLASDWFVQLQHFVFDAAFCWRTQWTDWSDTEIKLLTSLLFERSQISVKLWFITANSWGEFVLSTGVK